MLVKLEVNKRFEGLTIKELLKEYHVGKGKIEEIRVNKLVASIFRIRSKQRQKNYINSIGMSF